MTAIRHRSAARTRRLGRLEGLQSLPAVVKDALVGAQDLGGDGTREG